MDNGTLQLIEKSSFTSDSPDDALKFLKAGIDNGKIRVREIENFTTYKAPTISQVLNKNYGADPQPIIDSLVRFYQSWMTKQYVVKTEAVEEIHATLMLCWKRKAIGMIRGDFGKGKTKATHSFCSEYEFARFVQLNSSTNTISILNRLADAIGINSFSGSKEDKLQAIIRQLKRKPLMLIIDEADELNPRTLAILRDIHGDGEYCSIVMIVTHRFDKLIARPELGYLRSRITIKREIRETSLVEAKKIIDFWSHKLKKDDINKAYTWSMKQYSLRSLVALMNRAYDIAQMNNQKFIDSECIDEAYSWIVD
jgi:DNA transposition AAA+ family ATPase